MLEKGLMKKKYIFIPLTQDAKDQICEDSRCARGLKFGIHLIDLTL